MSKTLLITDDAVIIRTIISDLATDAGWDVVGEATNGKEAAELYREFQPDAVTLDIVMPEFDGLYGLRAIMEEDPNAKVVMVTALDQTDLLKEAFKIGAADFVVKPFDRSNLLETLEKLVDSSLDD